MTVTAAADNHTPAAGVVEPDVIDDELIARLAGQARAQGVSLVGEGGLLQQRCGPVTAARAPRSPAG